jgi:hypothetical protein
MGNVLRRDGHHKGRHVKVWAMNVFAVTACRSQRLSALALGVTLSLVASSAAWAQLGSGPIGTTGHAGRVPDAPQKPAEPSPDAIPGAKPREPAAPALHPAGDMQPTDALFDAINRGDIASARDALNRGADLNGVNILGMTPMELSVDLGRNDISFLLLSMRGEDGGRSARPVGRDAPPQLAPGKTAQAGKGAKLASGKGEAGKGGAAKGGAGKAAQANSIIPAKPIATPKLFANDGGTPLPSAGFLGFDSRGATN